MDIFTLNLMSTFNKREFFQWPAWASAVVTAYFNRASGSGCFSHTPLVRPSQEALFFLFSSVTEANKMEIKRLPGKKQKIFL